MKNKEFLKGIYRITDIDTMQIISVGASEKINASLLKIVHNRKRVFTKETEHYLVDYFSMENSDDIFYEKERWISAYLKKTYHYRQKTSKDFADAIEPLKPLTEEEKKKWKPLACRGDALSNLNTIHTVLEQMQNYHVADVPELGEQYCLTEEAEIKVRNQFCHLMNEKSMKT